MNRSKPPLDTEAARIAFLEAEDAMLKPAWWYLFLAIVPCVCILGNCMVVAAVWTTRSLQTPTNHLLVSLAMADLIVGAFVMPFSIYLSEMAGGQFLGFGADVGNITTSAIQSVIGKLFKICYFLLFSCSFRITSKHQNFQGIAPKNRNMITWEKPLLRKIEETAAEHASSLNDSEREQLQTILEAVHPSSSGSQENTTIEDDPDRPPSVLLEAVTLKCEIDTSGPVLELPKPTYAKNMSRRFSDAVQSISTRNRKKSVSFEDGLTRRRHSYQPEGSPVISDESKKLHSLKPPLVERRKMRRLSELISDWERPSRTSLSNMYTYARRESVYIARKKLAGLKDWALDLLAKLKSKQGMAIRRETRATKLVATVMVVFLACWLPFFTLNMIKIYKLIYNVWSTDLEIWFHWFTALGYLNSSLNFFIYSTINPKFRHSFRRLLGFRRSRKKKEKSWMLPPKDSSRGPAKCGCGFNKIVKSPLRKTSSARSLANRKASMQNPEIIIDEISPNRFSISAGGNTTFSGSGISNSSASLHIHETRMTFEAMVHDQVDVEIFV
uniref:G_PROTEIN_RECEP_F1_2 domain-containing protein n=1 Tax=Heterorhabditis bacteriophora TaxID=37862 RepID=A0A1I7XUV6_HETBA